MLLLALALQSASYHRPYIGSRDPVLQRRYDREQREYHQRTRSITELTQDQILRRADRDRRRARDRFEPMDDDGDY